MCEIVGIASYTPRTDVKDNNGRVIRTAWRGSSSVPAPREPIWNVPSGIRWNDIDTWSPAATVLTPAPTSSTSPAPSWPPMQG